MIAINKLTVNNYLKCFSSSFSPSPLFFNSCSAFLCLCVIRHGKYHASILLLLTITLVGVLIEAIEQGDIQKVRSIIEDEKKVSGVAKSTTQPDNFGQYPAHYAAVFGRLEVLDLLHQEKVPCMSLSFFPPFFPFFFFFTRLV